jgi:predicted transcriptional regulator
MDYATSTFFESLGLSKNERKIYEAALELGETTAANLAKRAKIHRVATYALIDNLITKGLLTQTNVSKHGKRIAPTHPREIMQLIRKEQRELKKLELKYEEIMPELTALFQNASVFPRVQFFEGIVGLEKINSDIINTLKDLPEKQRITYSYSNPNKVHETFEGYLHEEGGYIDLRLRHRIHNKVIALDCEVSRDIHDRSVEMLCDMAILPTKLFPFKNDITIYGDKMAILALENEHIGVIIQSREIVDDQKAIFHLAWEGAKVLAKTHETYGTRTTKTT